MIRRLLPIAAILVFAITAPAYAAHSFVLTRAGDKPNVAVDRGGTGHFVWDQRAADGGSVTHYCRVLRRDGEDEDGGDGQEAADHPGSLDCPCRVHKAQAQR